MERKDGEREFQLQDLSLGGLRAHFDDDPALIVGQQVHIRLPGLGLRGDVVPVRVRRWPREALTWGLISPRWTARAKTFIAIGLVRAANKDAP